MMITKQFLNLQKRIRSSNLMHLKCISSVVPTKFVLDNLNNKKLKVIDCSLPKYSEQDFDFWNLKFLFKKNGENVVTGRDSFNLNRIPGSFYFDLEKLCFLKNDEDKNFRNNLAIPFALPNLQDFKKFFFENVDLQQLNLCKDDHVIVYDNSHNFQPSAYIFWMFKYFGHDKISVLDGGFNKWQYENNPVDKGEGIVKGGINHRNEENINSNLRDLHEGRADKGYYFLKREVDEAQIFVDFETLLMHLQDFVYKDRFVMVDCRTKESLEEEGYIPGSINLPLNYFLDEYFNPDSSTVKFSIFSQDLKKLDLILRNVDFTRKIVLIGDDCIDASVLQLAFSHYFKLKKSQNEPSSRHIKHFDEKNLLIYEGGMQEWFGEKRKILKYS
ncbi:hypothetical protein HK099_000119 [Clydaea vesicula]|uniref:Rhodanese domain-containing protein n=1 Tax=Clydaea vesicula TaxID=447962 RepID=A0AAD5Y057_9FUNG|nr:hypothetical protein HK099_000119 [Clydaea vesicula]